MIKNKTQHNTGFVALMSSIIISVVLLMIATNLSLVSFYNRFNILDTELKAISTNLAEGCADTAILKVAHDLDYFPRDEEVAIGNNTCTIESVTGVNPITIETSADYQGYVTHLEVQISGHDLSVVSWQEI
jgi:hypothetical protein